MRFRHSRTVKPNFAYGQSLELEIKDGVKVGN